MLEKGTTIIAWEGCDSALAKKRMDVRQKQRVWGVFNSENKEKMDRFSTSTYFATRMPSRGCCAGGGYYNQSVVSEGVGWECSDEERMDVGQRW